MNVSGTPCKPPHGVFTEFPELAKNYLLSLGTLEPRKNLKRLIEAFRNLRLNNRVDDIDVESIFNFTSDGGEIVLILILPKSKSLSKLFISLIEILLRGQSI